MSEHKQEQKEKKKWRRIYKSSPWRNLYRSNRSRERAISLAWALYFPTISARYIRSCGRSRALESVFLVGDRAIATL